MISGWARTERSRFCGGTAAVQRPAPLRNAAYEARMPAPGFSAEPATTRAWPKSPLWAARRRLASSGLKSAGSVRRMIVFLLVLQVPGDADVDDADAAAVGIAVGIEVGPFQGMQGGGDPGLDMDAGSGGKVLAQTGGDVHGGNGEARAVDGVERFGEQPGVHRLVQAGAEHGIDQESFAGIAGGQRFFQAGRGRNRFGTTARPQPGVHS